MKSLQKTIEALKVLVEAERESKEKAEAVTLKFQKENDVLLISLLNENTKRAEFFEEYTKKEELLNNMIKQHDEDKKHLREKEKVLRGYITELTK